jgi:putative addiction module component (TIGR02574 family)
MRNKIYFTKRGYDMSANKKKILKEAMDLTPMERAQLIEDLFDTFQLKNRKEIDKLWAEEAEHRIDAYESGEILSRPVKDVFNDLNK